jgi:glycerol-3-phosphate cytidylyltransferase-like family protein
MNHSAHTFDQTAILSGRYELLHPGHVLTIRREAIRYRYLYVYVVDNPQCAIPSSWAHQLLQMATECLGNVQVLLNPCHFGRATKEDIDRLPHYDVFLSANPSVTEHLRSMGVNVREIERTPGYSSSDVIERIQACTVPMSVQVMTEAIA